MNYLIVFIVLLVAYVCNYFLVKLNTFSFFTVVYYTDDSLFLDIIIGYSQPSITSITLFI